MSTLLRLLKSARRFHAPAVSITKTNFEISVVDEILYPQSLLLTNRMRHHASMVVAHLVKQTDQESDIYSKIKKINQEINEHGKISKFNIDEIVNDIKTSGNVTSLQGLFLLRSCSEFIYNEPPELRKVLAENIWNLLKEFDVELDVSHFNALLTVYLEIDHNFSVLTFLEEMTNSGVKPNRVTFEKLILQLCKEEKLKKAEQLFEQIEHEEISISEKMLSPFIYHHCKNKNMEGVDKILEKMNYYNITSTIKTHSAFMYAYANQGDVERIKKILEECKSENIIVPNKVLLKIVYNLSICGFEQQINEILSLTTKSMDYVKEANKIIYKLIEKQQDKIAFKIFQTLPKNKNDYGNFFIQSLINCNVPVEKKIEYCRIMEEKEISETAFISAIKKSITKYMFDSSFTLMKTWKELGGQIKENYFYPILKAHGETGDIKDIEKILCEMVSEFNIIPSVHMLNTYILPHLSKDINEAMLTLLYFPIPTSNISNAILLYLLSNNEIQEATKYVNSHSSFYDQKLLKNSLLQAFKNTEDVASFVWFLHYFYMKSLEDNDTSKNTNSIQFLDSCILDVIDFLRNNKYLCFMVFRNLHENGLSISPEAAEKIKEKLDMKTLIKIEYILNELKSGKLVPKATTSRNYQLHHFMKTLDVEKLEKTASKHHSNSVALSCMQTKALIHYCYCMNEAKVEELLKEFKNSDRHITESIHALLICMYVNLGKIDKAEFWLNEGRNKFPNFGINKIMNLKLMTALVENGEIKKAEQYIEWSIYSNVQKIALNKLLTAIAKYNDEELLHRFFDQLSEHGYVGKLSPNLLQPFVQLHISRNDGKAAQQKFQWLYNTYGQTPYPIDLMKKLITDKDQKILDQITTFYENIFGKSKCYFYLAIAHLENNDLKTARDLIQQNCVNISEKNVLHFAENYYSNGQIDKLEKLFAVLNESKFDVECLCVLLLKSYSLKKEWRKCYELWLKMQEDRIRASPTFYAFFDEILESKEIENNKSLKRFHDAIQNSDLVAARNMLDSIPKIYKSDCYSILCQKYISSGYTYIEILDLWRDLNERFNLNLNLYTAEFILGKLQNLRELRNIEVIGTYLTPELKKQLNYSYYLNKTYAISGSWNLYLKKLEKNLYEGNICTDDDLDMHYKTALYTLLKYPELLNQFESLAYKYSEKNINSLLYVLWGYYFLEKNPQADEIWNKYVSNPKLFYELKIMSFLQYHNDLSYYVKLVKLIRQSNFHIGVKTSIYSNLLKTCMESGHPHRYNYSLKCLQLIISEIPMEQFDIDLLADLQKGLEQFGMFWPWSHKPDQKSIKVIDSSSKTV